MRKLPRLLVLLAALALPAHAQTYVNVQTLPVPATGSTDLSVGDTVVADRNGVTYGLFYNPITTSPGGAFLNGQLLIGNTGTGYMQASTLAAGSNVTITNGAGSIEIAAVPNNTFFGLVSGNGIISNGTTFTITSGCGSGGSAPSSLTGGATTGSFVSNVTSCVPVIALPTAPNGWWCRAQDLTHTADLFVQTATSTTSCTLSATVSDSDTILIHAEGY